MKTQTKHRPTDQFQNSKQLTFMEHVMELRKRLFWIAGTVLGVSALAFPFYNLILNVLTWPLDGQTLYYLSPAGGFGLIMKLCFYVGIVVAIPVTMYQLYRYLEPVLTAHRQKLVRYVSLSTVLAIVGICFAYFVSLPAALKFLTGIGIDSVQAMLTADAYLSFVMSYLLAGALLFQLPLVMTVINNIKPLQPKKLMSAMRYVVVGAFLVAAVISPTPDAANQTLLALPMIMMYLLGVAMISFKNRRSAVARQQGLAYAEPKIQIVPRAEPTEVLVLHLSESVPIPVRLPIKVQARPQMPLRSIDGVIRPLAAA